MANSIRPVSDLTALLARYFPPPQLTPSTTAPLEALHLREALNPALCSKIPTPPAQVFQLTGKNLWVWKAELRARLLWQFRGSHALPVLQNHTTTAFLFISYASTIPHITACAALPTDWATIKDKPNLPLHFLQSNVGISRVILLPELILSLQKYTSVQIHRVLNT